MSMDLSQFHDTFFEESAEGLDDMETSLLNIDLDGDYSEDINTIFRGAHSIKGGSATFGFKDVADFTHVMETLLDQARSGERQLDQQNIDLLLRSVDCLRNMMAALRNNEDTDKATTSEIQAQLEAVLASGDSGAKESEDITEEEFEALLDELHGSGKGPSATASTDTADDISDDEFERLQDELHGVGRGPGSTPAGKWKIRFVPGEHLLATGNDPVRLLRELGTLGSMSVTADLSRLPDFDNVDPESCYLSWNVELQSDCSEQDIREVFAWVDTDCDIDIEAEAVANSSTAPNSAAASSPLEDSFMLIAPRADDIAAAFYDQLFRVAPDARPLFASVNMDAQQAKLVGLLETIVDCGGDPAKLEAKCEALGEMHWKLGAPREAYPLVVDTLLSVVAQQTGSEWQPAWTEAWRDVLNYAASVMTRCYKDDAPAAKSVSGGSTMAAAAGESKPTTPPAAPQAATAKKKPPVTAEASSIRVGIDKVDELINMVGELVITQSMLSQIGDNFDMKNLQAMQDGLAELEQNTRQLQESVMRIRMLPISFAFNRFPRLVRDLSSKLGKKIELKMTGEQTELDKTVMEKIGDPLVHLVRNSIDHGIEMPDVRARAGKPETGVLHLNAYHQGGNIVIEINDDGAGLNTDKILSKAKEKGIVPEGEVLSDEEVHELIFHPGFSTADQVSDLSGRGVGMDVVRRNIRSLGGRVDIRSARGQGSSMAGVDF